jgi:hypothetical protein
MPILNDHCSLRRVLVHYLATGSAMIALLFIGFASTGLAADGFYPDMPGTWVLTTDWKWLPEDIRPSPAHTQAFTQKVKRLAEQIHQTPLFSPPRGFQARARARFLEGGAYACDDKHCPSKALQAEIGLLFYYFFDTGGKPSWGGEANTDATISINCLERTAGLDYQFGRLSLPDGRYILFAPVKTGELGGFPLYHEHLIITRGKRPYWIPVTREQYLQALIRATEVEIAKSQKQIADAGDPYEKFLKEKGQRALDYERIYQDARKLYPDRAEALRTQLLLAEAAAEKGSRQASEMLAKFRQTEDPMQPRLTNLQAELAAMSPGKRASQAWFQRNADALIMSDLVPAGQENATPLIAYNPDFFDPALPPTAWQIMTVKFAWANHEHSAMVGHVGFARLHQFAYDTDWSRMAPFLD